MAITLRSTHVAAYKPPGWLRSGHLQTVYASIVRSVEGVAYERERIETPDGDFLDVDWVPISAPRCSSGRPLVVISHGLEGDTGRPYVRGMARAFHRSGYDVLAWNYRGCSGEPNRLVRSYHSGATDDLRCVLDHARASGHDRLALVGFSLGGNLTLKYLAEEGEAASDIAAAVAFSVPVDLAAGARQLARWSNRGYMAYFMRKLRRKVHKKARLHADVVTAGLDRMRTFAEFDDAYTAPWHGFDGAEDYWARCSAKPHLHRIAVPTLLVNALDDPFLPDACYPVSEADGHPHFRLETPRYGGHVGFVDINPEGLYWSERRTLAFVEAQLARSVGVEREEVGRRHG